MLIVGDALSSAVWILCNRTPFAGRPTALPIGLNSMPARHRLAALDVWAIKLKLHTTLSPCAAAAADGAARALHWAV